MVGVLRALRDNAAAPGRRRSYRLVTSISGGYDSGAVAVIAVAAGCDTAVTLRSGKYRTADSGRAVAEALGLRCIERDRRVEGTGDDPHPEVDFIVSFDPGTSVISAFSDILPGSLFLVGYHGDGLWDPNLPPNDTIRRKDPSGMGLHEFRLRKDFITVPLVFVGATRHSDVRDISLSEEMRPFRVGGDYDRPIARRLLEEAGVSGSCSATARTPSTSTSFSGSARCPRRPEGTCRRSSRVGRDHGAWRGRACWHGPLRGRCRARACPQCFLARHRAEAAVTLAARRANWYMRHNWDLETRYYFSCVLIWALHAWANATRRLRPSRLRPLRAANLSRTSSPPDRAARHCRSGRAAHPCQERTGPQSMWTKFERL